jgi:hypothetical protein
MDSLFLGVGSCGLTVQGNSVNDRNGLIKAYYVGFRVVDGHLCWHHMASPDNGLRRLSL